MPTGPVCERSGKWPAVRRRHLAEHPSCIACGTAENLEVHHLLPVHLFPEKELEPSNLVTLCESPSHNCHLLFGHGLCWSAYNEKCVELSASTLYCVKFRTY